jgi:ribosome modulation factor
MAGGYGGNSTTLKAVQDKSSQLNKIYDEGWEARLSDARKKDCPYTNKAEKASWLDGYEDAGINYGRGTMESKEEDVSKAAKLIEELKEQDTDQKKDGKDLDPEAEKIIKYNKSKFPSLF